MSEHLNKFAVVTGAARGIGQAIAKKMAQEGADIICIDLGDSEETKKIVEGLGRKYLSYKADVSNLEQLKEVASSIYHEVGPIHILINNAGLHPHMTMFDDVDEKLWKKTMEVNFDSMFYTAKAFVPHMRENKWGRIVNMSSSVVNVAPEGGIHYIASKAGVLGLTRGLARELGKDNITVNAIAPSVVETPGLDGTGMPQEMLDAVIAQQSIKVMSQVDDLTGTIKFLCSEDARLYTGQHVHLDGGIVFGD